MASRSFRTALARAGRRIPRGAGIAAVLALTASVAVAAAGPGWASATWHRTAGTAEARVVAAVGAAVPQTAPQAAREVASAPLPALSRVRLERSAAARDLDRLREFQRKAQAVGLPVDRPHERALAEALRHKIALLKKLERELLRDLPSERRSHTKTKKPGKQTKADDVGRAKPGKTSRAVAKPAVHVHTTTKNAAKVHKVAENAKRHVGAKAKVKQKVKAKAKVKQKKGLGRRAKAVAFARAQLGKPYRWGGAGPGSFDCSGLVMRAWKHAGVSIPRVTTSQWGAGKRISRSQLRPGDLVFRSGRGHVMLYAGNGRVIHAPRSGTTVQWGPLPPHSQVNGYVSVV